MPYRIGDRVRVKSLEALTAISEDAKDVTPTMNGFHIDHLFLTPACCRIAVVFIQFANTAEIISSLQTMPGMFFALAIP